MVEKKTGISRELLIHPGETISDVLESRGISQSELAMRTGVTPAYVSSVINGKKDISAKFAMALEYALGVKKTFWLNLQANYDAELLELYESETISDEEKEARTHLNDVVKFLVSQGKIPAKDTKENSILSLRKALRISDISNLPKCAMTGAFRMSDKVKIDPFVLGAWIRMCQIVGEMNSFDEKYDVQRIPELVSDLKTVMMNPDGNIQNDLKSVMQRYGIDFSIAHNFKGAPVQGYVSQKVDGSYQIVVTIRGAYADVFWFSIFHELGHLVNGDLSNGTKFVDDGSNLEMERKADVFASNCLLDEVGYRRFVNFGNYSLNAIRDFAASQGVMPYIVIGRMKKDKILEYSKYSDQMLRYKWDD